MSKKRSFSFDGMIDEDARPDAPAGVQQRGDAPNAAEAPRKVGRPSKGRANAPRPSFALEPELHAEFKIWLLRRGISMQDYLEGHIREIVGAEN